MSSRHIAVVMASMSLALVVELQPLWAGVRGNSYVATFDPDSAGFQAVLAFEAEGQSMYFQGPTGVIPGQYAEVDLVVVSLFSFALNNSDRFRGVGVSLLSRQIVGVAMQDDASPFEFIGTLVLSRARPTSGAR